MARTTPARECRWERRTARRERARQQTEARSQRSTEEQLALIATRPGQSAREVQRLLLKRAAQKQHAAPTESDLQGGVDFILDTSLGGK